MPGDRVPGEIAVTHKHPTISASAEGDWAAGVLLAKCPAPVSTPATSARTPAW